MGGKVSQSAYARNAGDRSARTTSSVAVSSAPFCPRRFATKSANIRLTPCQTPRTEVKAAAKKPTRNTVASVLPKPVLEDVVEVEQAPVALGEGDAEP